MCRPSGCVRQIGFINANIYYSENVSSISKLLNLEPNVADNNTEKAIDIICPHFKQVYSSLL